MFKLVSILAFLCLAQMVRGQTVIASAGNSSASGNVHLSWTIGETITFTGITSTRILTNGFQQASIVVSPIARQAGEDISDFEVSVFPNPTQDILTISTNPEEQHAVTITHLSGELVKSFLVQGKVEVDIKDLSAGIYLLSIVSKTTKNSFRIIKIQ
ncbi:T9SS type A sorting domain-containing protein [Rhodocytophaga aerolata]|uniref:T9SS type A sorting domain-containing protein n=1 Tax=Rhodocytophaga aerolata TaxID=455078 RepID=A0ABT8R4I8_9BACT|nr:T9SS type A sorting domain-containing protein [Rhodocytophaga aerolata]MDO1446319.1 T9SS type A sorting domain-containing protein [Rhodocytophaga aerolata]